VTHTNDSVELANLCDTLNQSSPVKVILNGAISNMENLKQSYGSLAAGLQFRLTKYKVGKNNSIDPRFIYVMFNTKTATSPDSSSIQKTFLFPELNKRDFVLGYYSETIKNDWSYGPVAEFSMNRFVDTSDNKTFVSQCFLAGWKVSKAFKITSPNLNVFLQFFPYYSVINVDPKFSKDYTGLLKEENIHATYHSIGLQTSVQIDNAVLFCNMKYILNKARGIQSPDLVRFIYTIGTSVSL